MQGRANGAKAERAGRCKGRVYYLFMQLIFRCHITDACSTHPQLRSFMYAKGRKWCWRHGVISIWRDAYPISLAPWQRALTTRKLSNSLCRWISSSSLLNQHQYTHPTPMHVLITLHHTGTLDGSSRISRCAMASNMSQTTSDRRTWLHYGIAFLRGVAQAYQRFTV